MPNKDNQILKYTQGEKSMETPFIIYADLECLLKKISTCHNNPEKSYTEKILCIKLLVIQFLQILHLTQRSCTQQKANLVVIEAKIIWKGFVRI